VNARLVRERVAADDRLVHLHALAGQLRQHLAGGVELAAVDAGRVGHPVLAHLERHDDLLDRGVAGALADAVDRALDLPRAAAHRGQRVGDTEAEVIVAVRAEHDRVGVRHALADRLEELEDLVRRRVADGVGQVDRAGAGLDHRLDHAAQEVHVAAGGVLGRELHVERVVARVAHRLDRGLEALLAADAELGGQVQVGRGDERVDAAALGRLDRPHRLLEIGPMTAGQAGNHRPAHFQGNAAHRFGIRGRRNREPGFDDVDTQQIELPGKLDLLRRPQRETRRLLAVPKCGVEDSNLFLSHGTPLAGDRPHPSIAAGIHTVKMIIILFELPGLIVGRFPEQCSGIDRTPCFPEGCS
jgi:hypothetical protein